jgi:hypothetical protein
MHASRLKLLSLGIVLTAGLFTHFLPLGARFPHLRTATLKQSSLPPRIHLPNVQDVVGDCAWLDDDGADESSSSRQQIEPLVVYSGRLALAHSCYRLQPPAHHPCGEAFPLFYAFCTLLI